MTSRDVAALRDAWRALQPSTSGPCWRLAAGDEPRLYVTGMIGMDERDTAEFVQAVHGLGAPRITVHINSPGGFLWDAMDMYGALKAHPAHVTAHVDGLAASAASVILQAGDDRVMGTGSRAMIHDAQTVAVGSPDELRAVAALGDMISDDIAAVYAERAGGKPAGWRTAMRATTWYSAAEAVGANLADRVSVKQESRPGNRSRLVTARARALSPLGG